MKTTNKLIYTVFILFCYLSLEAQTVEITKGTDVPDNVCNQTEYSYKIKYTVPSTGWNLSISSVLGSVNNSQTVNSNGEITVNNTWNATSDSNIGKLKAKLSKGTSSYEDEITATIKSILHLKPDLSHYAVGTNLYISPCQTGQESLEVSLLEVPGTGTNSEKVYDYLWTLPSGWSMNGVTSAPSNS